VGVVEFLYISCGKSGAGGGAFISHGKSSVGSSRKKNPK